MLAVCGLATATLAQQDNGLILASGQEVPVGSLGHAVNVRGSVLLPAALEHLHHLERGGTKEKMKEKKNEDKILQEKSGYLLGVHRGGANGVDDHHVGPSMGVHQITTIALPEGVHHTRLVQVLQRGQVLHPVKHRRVCLQSKSETMTYTLSASCAIDVVHS